jgi:hypothetical protein
MRRRLLIIGGLCVLAALGAAWFYMNFERVPYKERVGPSSEVRLRPYLAAQRFAERMDVKASEVRSLPQLDALTAGGALLMPARRQALDARRLGQVVGWVDRGGHLIVEAELAGVPDPLLDLLAVGRIAVEPGAGKPLPVDVGEGRRLAVTLPPRMGLQPRQAGKVLLHAGPADAPSLVSYRRGSGFVTVATSLQFAQNRLIGENDHAEFLWHLLNLNPATPTLQVFNSPQRLSLWGFLKAHAPEALACSLALLVLWLWRIAPRFGPVAPDAPAARRRLLDHLRASGRYYWANGLRAKLVAAARDAALRRLVRAQPDFAAAPQAEKVSRLALLMGISPEEASRFLVAAGPMRGADFIRLARHAQRAHAALEKGKK